MLRIVLLSSTSSAIFFRKLGNWRSKSGIGPFLPWKCIYSIEHDLMRGCSIVPNAVGNVIQQASHKVCMVIQIGTDYWNVQACYLLIALETMKCPRRSIRGRAPSPDFELFRHVT